MKSMLTAMKAYFHRSKPILNGWLSARLVWSASDTVEIGLTGSRPALGRCAEELLKVISSPTGEAQMLEGLEDSDPRIVAYSLAGLEMLNSAALDHLPSSLLSRNESVRLLTGSSLIEMPLKTFTEEVTKRRIEARSLDRWLSYGRKLSAESLPAYLSQLAPPTPDARPQAPRG